MAKKSTRKGAAAKERPRSRLPLAAAIVATVATVLALVVGWFISRVNKTKWDGGLLLLAPNGGGPTLLELDRRTWPEQLHAEFPNAQRVGLWDVNGTEWAWSEHNGEGAGQTGGSLPTIDTGASHTVYAVLDHYPFVWPVDVGYEPRSVSLGDDRPTMLRVLSISPRVLIADGVFTEAECDVVRRLAAPRMRESTQYAGGVMSVVAARNSDSAWMPPVSAMDVVASSDEVVMMTVQKRLAALSRVHMGGAEDMQVIRYRPGQHYHYHTDTGGSPNIAGRALTALVYLNDDFEGGQTSFPTAGLVEPIKNTYRVRERYGGGCQVEEGLTVSPRQGSVVLFYNLEPNSADKDYFAWHGSCDVLRGEKWAANYWFHLERMRRLHARDGSRPQNGDVG